MRWRAGVVLLDCGSDSEEEAGNDAGHSDEPEGSRERMNKRQTWVRAEKLQPGDRIQDANGNVVTIKDVSKGLFPESILITLQDADPDFAYLESDTKIFVE
jgi:hypothetical protein